MRKLTVLAMLAAVLIATPMFAVGRSHPPLTAAPNATFSFGVGGAAFGPSTTNNNDTCDIGVAPAATLLLPYFEVDFNSPSTTARTTLFTITNTSRQPAIAHVVLWTDWSYAALDFNIFLTGYDVQPINLYDIFARGIIAPPSGTSINGSANGPATPPNNGANGATGAVPLSNTTGNPNFLASAIADCVSLPGNIPTNLLSDLRTIFTTGAAGTTIGAGCSVRLGGTHANAIGYATVDVAAHCSTSLPGPGYFSTEVLFDNVLIGDYQHVSPNVAVVNAAGGAPMVHIRAVPEGGVAGSNPIAAGGTAPTNLPFTFYDRYTGSLTQVGRAIDRRQPLPNTFAARWIQGGAGSFNTNYQIWREGLGSTTGSSTQCSAVLNIPGANSVLAITDEVRFDEHENAVGITVPAPISPAPAAAPSLPETSNTPTSSSLPFPPAVPGSADVGGWMYLNLTNGGTGAADFRLTAQRAGFGPALGQRTTTQNWVTVNMQAESRFSVLFDAAWLANGCTPAPLPGAVVAPGSQRPGGLLVCPPPLVIGTAGQCGVGTQVPAVTP